MCAQELAQRHRHLVNTANGELSCACDPCAVLFDHQAAGGGALRLIRARPRRLDDFVLDNLTWAGLGVPVGLAFFVRSGQSVVAHYPNPIGTMRAEVDSSGWAALQQRNPRLSDMESHVEALLIDRLRDGHEHWLLPLDDCYRLIAVLRAHWQGFSGGDEVWQHIDRFFGELREGRTG